MDKVEKARIAYIEIAQEILKYAEYMNEKLAEEAESGISASFLHEEIKRKLHKAFH